MFTLTDETPEQLERRIQELEAEKQAARQGCDNLREQLVMLEPQYIAFRQLIMSPSTDQIEALARHLYATDNPGTVNGGPTHPWELAGSYQSTYRMKARNHIMTLRNAGLITADMLQWGPSEH